MKNKKKFKLLPKNFLLNVCETYYKYIKNRDSSLFLSQKNGIPYIYYECKLVATGSDCIIVLINFYEDYERYVLSLKDKKGIQKYDDHTFGTS